VFLKKNWRRKDKLLAFTYELNLSAFIFCRSTEQNAAGATGWSMVEEGGVKRGPRGTASVLFILQFRTWQY